MIYVHSIAMIAISCLFSSCIQCLATSQSIDDIFPSLASKSLGIDLIPNAIGKVDAYQVSKFIGQEINRNHFDSRQGSGVKYLVMHYTVCDLPTTLNLFTKNISDNRVSAHYVVSEAATGIEGGKVFQVVPDEERAWHAGISYWGGQQNLNAKSIGIENVNKGFVRYSDLFLEQKQALLKATSELESLVGQFGEKSSVAGIGSSEPSKLNEEIKLKTQTFLSFYEDSIQPIFTLARNTPRDYQWFPFDQAQIKILGILSQHLVKKYEIQPYNVIGHADIAPGRKQDPGILFPWGHLFEQYKIGAWLTKDELTEEAIGARYNPKEPLPKGVSEAFMSKYLSNYGYKIEELSALTPELGLVLTSFRAHFSHNLDPSAYKEEIDEMDMFWIWALEAKYGSYHERKP